MAKKYLGTSLSRFGNDERGNMAMTFAFCITMVMGVMGAAVDFRMASTAEDRSQQIADAVALQGAVYVKNAGHVPTEDSTNGVPEGDHSAAELGFEYSNFVNQGAEGVNINVDYDDNAKEVTVTVSGETNTTFTRILGRETVPFETVSVASYLEIDEAFPASIALVLDNSGSMAWDDRLALPDNTSPTDAQPRIDGLKTSVKTFTSELNGRLGDRAEGDYRTMRMGMLPYSSDTIHTRVVNMGWGFIEDSDVNVMRASGATNSSPPMATALSWMVGEDDFHEDEAEAKDKENAKDPLKFVILMSDGDNSVGGWEFYPSETAPVYWKQRDNGSWTGVWAHSYNATQHVGYTRGDLRRATDRMTLESCTAMKNTHNVEIFTIGYALEEGKYNANNPYNDKATATVNAWTKANATNLLTSCASSDKHFIWAKDADELEAAFDRIQNDIVEEIIRIKS